MLRFPTPTKLIPARELRDGYTIIIDGSPQEINKVTAENIGDDINPIVRMWIDIGDGKTRLFDADAQVLVVLEEGEY